MKDLYQILHSFIPTELVQFCHQHYILKLSLFGSILHGQFTSTSDLDLLVEFDLDHYPGLFALARMEEELAIQTTPLSVTTFHPLLL